MDECEDIEYFQKNKKSTKINFEITNETPKI